MTPPPSLFNIFDFLFDNLHIPTLIRWTDVVEVIIIAALTYRLLVWIRDTRAWNLLKGLLVILVFFAVATILNMSTILWLGQRIFSVAALGIVVGLQPELRRALDTLGRNSFLTSVLPGDLRKSEEGRFSDKTIFEIIRACQEMSRARTGALIVMARQQTLQAYELTGIEVDAVVTSQLLLNIFEKNTPLHDGAVIIDQDRVRAATCYLPISENMDISKDLGTRHRAALGLSEVTDTLTIIVSEETGQISVASFGEIRRNLDGDALHDELVRIQDKPIPQEKKKWSFMKKHPEKDKPEGTGEAGKAAGKDNGKAAGEAPDED